MKPPFLLMRFEPAISAFENHAIAEARYLTEVARCHKTVTLLLR